MRVNYSLFVKAAVCCVLGQLPIHSLMAQCSTPTCVDSCPYPIYTVQGDEIVTGPSDWCQYPVTGCPGSYEQAREGCCWDLTSPIIIDLKGDGLDLTSPLRGVPFAVSTRGPLVRLSWTKADSDDAWLALDRDGDGQITHLGELFGNLTEPRSAHGFAALSIFDLPEQGGNGDGWISARDSVFSRLRLWTDVNHNGQSEPLELLPLQAAGISAMSLSASLSARKDVHGNQFRYRSVVLRTVQAETAPFAWDVFLQGHSLSNGGVK